ncbi:MAG: methyltransferase type 11 [uncultured bacterium]|nr:MAG: methyltransferase type 11 [uncultured bacterium]
MEESKNVIGKFLDPSSILETLNMEKGSVVADFGCGPGYFSIPIAKVVGEQGRVYSLDILPQALETVASKAKNLGILNITTKRVNLEKENGTKLEDGSADWVILKDILFQNQDKNTIIREAHRVLKNEGRALVVEWNQKDSTVGPAREIRVPQVTLEKMFSEHGFIIEKNIDAEDFHYAFVAMKS